MDQQSAKEKLAAVRGKFGRDIRVFETLVDSPTQSGVSNDESDDFYELTVEDYHRILSAKKEDKFLKTRKIREAEVAAQRSRITKAVIRVRFPDNHTLESTFHASETIQSLIDLLMKVVSQPDLPFYIYTTPPKKRVKDMTLDFYSAGFIPGAIVYFSYDLPKGDDGTAASAGPFLQEDIISLKDLELEAEQADLPQSDLEPVAAAPATAVLQERKPATDKKPTKPKWFKM